MPIIIFLVFLAVVWWLTRSVQRPAPVQTEAELRDTGLTGLQTRRELRAQRGEIRYHTNTVGHSLRTAATVARLSGLVTRSGKSKKWPS